MVVGVASTSLVFVSHASDDKEEIAPIAEVLALQGYRVYASSHPAFATEAGAQWERDIYTRLRNADALVFVLTAASLASRWCFAEIAFAKAAGKPILTVQVGEAPSSHPLVSARQNLLWGRAESANGLAAWLDRHVGAPVEWEEGVCPYPGMEAFSPSHWAVFFGREEAISDLLPAFAPLASGDGLRRVVAVSGPSGCGKSSLLRAGLIPRLSRRPGWRVLPPMRVGRDPVRNLADSLAAGVPGSDPALVRQGLLDGDLGILADLTSGGGDDESADAVITIDQLEELETLGDPPERDRFLKLLESIATSPYPVWVLLSVRAEFMTNPGENSIARFAGRRALVYLLPPLPADSALIRQIVTEPARIAGATVANELVDLIVNDVAVGDRTGGSLPLLAFALAQTWQHMEDRKPDRADRVLVLDDYEAVGGIHGVITRQATAAYRRLVMRGVGDIVLPTLARFARPGAPGEAALRRRVELSSLSDPARLVAREYEQHRLLRVTAMEDTPTVEVTHEAVFRTWDLLRDYLAEHEQVLRDVTEAERLTRVWVSHERDPTDLMRGALLQRMMEVTDLTVLTDSLVVEYLEASIATDRDVQLAMTRDKAVRKSEDAILQLDSDAQAATALVLEAVQLCEEFQTDPPDEVQQALFRVMCEARELSLHRALPGPISALAVSASHGVAVGAADGTVQLWPWGATDASAVFESGCVGLTSLAFGADGRRLFVAGRDGQIKMSVLGDGGAPMVVFEDVAIFPAHSLAAVGNRYLVATGVDGYMQVWDLADDVRQVSRVPAHWSYGVRCSGFPDGERVASAGADGDLAVWRLPELELVGRVRSHEGPVSALAIAPDGQCIATGGLDGVVRTWTTTLTPRGWSKRTPSRMVYVTALAFSQTGRSLLVGASDGVVQQLDLDGHRTESDVTIHQGPVTGVVGGGESDLAMSSEVDGTIRWWRFAGAQVAEPIADLHDTVEALAFLGDDRLLVASEDLVVSYATDGRRIGEPWAAHTDHVWDVDVSSDRQYVVTSGGDGMLNLWTGDGEHVKAAGTHVGGTGLPALRFVGDTMSIVTGGADGAVTLWTDAPELRPSVLGYHDGQVNKVDVIPTANGSLVVTAGDDGCVRLWDLAGTRRATLRVSRQAVKALAVSPNFIFADAGNGEIVAIDHDLSDCVERVVAHQGRVTELVTHRTLPLASIGTDGRLRRWSELLRPAGQPIAADPVASWSLAVSSSGRVLASGGLGSVKLWRAGDWQDWWAVLDQTSPEARATPTRDST